MPLKIHLFSLGYVLVISLVFVGVILLLSIRAYDAKDYYRLLFFCTLGGLVLYLTLLAVTGGLIYYKNPVLVQSHAATTVVYLLPIVLNLILRKKRKQSSPHA